MVWHGVVWVGTDHGDTVHQEKEPRDWSSFLFTSEFLYFHSFLMMLQVILSLPILLQVANASFFLGTVSYLGDHWRRTTSLVTTTDSSANFTVVIKLFFIMGIPWLGEFVSHFVTHRYGREKTFYIRLALDILPMFSVTVHPTLPFYISQGFLVFLTLVFKKKTLRRVANRLSQGSLRGRPTRQGTLHTTFSR